MSDLVRLDTRKLPESGTGRSAPADEAVLASRSGLLDGTSRDDAAVLVGQHILVCTCTETGVTTYAGPYPSGYDALASLEQYESDQQPDAGLRTVVCEVAPLLPG